MKSNPVKKIIGDSPVLFEYVRERGSRNRKIGIIVAVENGKVGWALCKKAGRVLIDREVFVDSAGLEHISETWKNIEGDKFNFEIAFGKACKRAWNGGTEYDDLPFSITKKYEEMIERSIRYFKKEE